MNLIILAASQSQLLAKAEIDQAGLESVRRDAHKQFGIKAKECYLVYDEQGGITVLIVLDIPDGRQN